MRGKKKLTIAILVVLILAAAAAGVLWYINHYVMIDFKSYPRNEAVLDLRGQEITYEHYDEIHRQLPETKILWDVPFQGGVCGSDTKKLTITTLSDSDVEVMDYFTELESVDASTCKDYAQLLALQQRRPEVELDFTLELGGDRFFLEARKIVLTGIAKEEIPLLQCLQSLETVAISGGEAVENFAALQEYCRDNGYTFQIVIDGASLAEDTKEVTVSGIDEAELNLLQFLPKMEKLHLKDPKAPVESLLALQASRADVEITWTQTICGKEFSNTETLIDISNTEVTDLDAVARAMSYFPDAEQLEMHFCGVDNETMAAFREEHREEYKVVWTVYLGPLLPTRTDVTSIMPARDGTSDFHDAEAYNMRYCEDVIAVDVGHLDVRNVEWAAFMPHLKYLILAWTGVRDLTPLSGCKELVWLELDYSPVKDTTPLIGCTALEDINIGASGIDPTGLCQMPWLKNVWAIFNPGAGYKVAQACPDTRVVATGSHTVSSGWRRLPNYYAMRDALNMFYMDQ